MTDIEREIATSCMVIKTRFPSENSSITSKILDIISIGLNRCEFFFSIFQYNLKINLDVFFVDLFS